MKKILLFVIILFSFNSCNFNIFRTVLGSDDDNTKALVSDGERLISEGKYNDALNKFNSALQKDQSLSRARVGRVKAKFGMQVDINAISRFADKIRGYAPNEPDDDPYDNQPILIPSDFNFPDNDSGILAFYKFANDNFVDLHQVIYGPSDGEIGRNDVSINLDCSALSLLTGILYIQLTYKNFNSLWNDTLKGYYFNLEILNIPPQSTELEELEEHLNYSYSCADRAFNNSIANNKDWILQYKDIIWLLFQEVKFYRSL